MDCEVACKANEIAQAAMKTYSTHDERSALRCALGDAATLCDIISTKIGNEHRGRGNKISKRGQELAAIAKRCGDEIWEMRERVVHPEPIT